MIITNNALAKMVLINTGCKTFMPKKEENLTCIFRLVLTGKDFDTKEIERKLPQKTRLYSNLEFFAQSLGLKIITVETVYRFFGTEVHAQMIRDQIDAAGITGSFANKYYFAHMLTPVIIESEDGKNDYSAYYLQEEKSVKVEIRGLMNHPLIPIRTQIGDIALIHYATIIDYPDNDLAEALCRVQKNIPGFIESAKNIAEIDYHKFWGLRSFAQDLARKCF